MLHQPHEAAQSAGIWGVSDERQTEVHDTRAARNIGRTTRISQLFFSREFSRMFPSVNLVEARSALAPSVVKPRWVHTFDLRIILEKYASPNGHMYFKVSIHGTF